MVATIIFGVLIIAGLGLIVYNQFKIRKLNTALSNIMLSFVKGNNAERAERVEQNIYAILSAIRGKRQYSLWRPTKDGWEDAVHDGDYE